MGRPRLKLEGKKFGKLTVVRSAGVSAIQQSLWLCRCECGKEHTTSGHNLISSGTRSCGCLVVEKATRHGHNPSGNPSLTYRCWRDMLNRCRNTCVKGYERYGGRGIQVCKRWLDFRNFLADMGEKPLGLELDRINNDGNYAPGNCRWTTHKEQTRNRRTSRLITWRRKTKTLAEWAEITGVNAATIHHRLNTGQSVSAALTTPVESDGRFQVGHKKGSH